MGVCLGAGALPRPFADPKMDSIAALASVATQRAPKERKAGQGHVGPCEGGAGHDQVGTRCQGGALSHDVCAKPREETWPPTTALSPFSSGSGERLQSKGNVGHPGACQVILLWCGARWCCVCVGCVSSVGLSLSLSLLRHLDPHNVSSGAGKGGGEFPHRHGPPGGPHFCACTPAGKWVDCVCVHQVFPLDF